jgi:hypothetical protein
MHFDDTAIAKHLYTESSSPIGQPIRIISYTKEYTFHRANTDNQFLRVLKISYRYRITRAGSDTDHDNGIGVDDF